MSEREFAEIFEQIGGEKWQESLNPTKASYTEFEISIAESVRFINTIQGILPQIYLSLQYQIKDPKTDPGLRKDLGKRAMKLEATISPGIDEVWKISSKMTYVALVNKMTMDRKKAVMLKKMESEG